MRRVRTLVFLVLAASLLSSVAASQRRGVYNFERVRSVIDSVMRNERIPSVAVAVAKGERILWEQGFGYANVEYKIRATALTQYSLASISKPFTATGIMVLAQHGAVRLRDPVNRYLGGVHVTAREGEDAKITLERLLTHTAGLPLHYQFFYEDGGYRRPPMDSTIRRYGVAVYPPGEAYQYSNLGYGILDYVIARASRLSYADFMRREVFAPLALMRTSVGLPAGLNFQAAQRYDSANRAIPYYTFDHAGASEVYSSANDLVRFGMFHLGARVPQQRRILAPETLKEMQREAAAESPGYGRGLGWSVRKMLGVRQVSHSGAMPGVSTFLALYPEDGVVVVVLMNKSVPAATEAIATELSASVIPFFANGLRLARAAPRSSPLPAVDSAQLHEVVGEWRGFVYTDADSVVATLAVPDAGTPRLSVRDEPFVELSGFTLQSGVLGGRAAAQFANGDAARQTHQIGLWLRAREGRLSGYAAALATAPRLRYALSSYVRLERVTRVAAPNEPTPATNRP
ncbi:MAG: serine hydrolase domain-containing protein [Gemmatimonadaceae bacterium]